jgi:hypothetical protein
MMRPDRPGGDGPTRNRRSPVVNQRTMTYVIAAIVVVVIIYFLFLRG